MFLLLLLCLSNVLGSEDFDMITLEPKSGIYFEHLGSLKFSSAIWRLVVSIDISKVQTSGTHSHMTEIMKNVMEPFCRSLKDGQFCDMFENMEENLLEKAKRIDVLTEQIRLAIDDLPINQNQSEPEELETISSTKNWRYFEDPSEIKSSPVLANFVINSLITSLSNLEESCKNVLEVIRSSKKGIIPSSVISEDQLTKIESEIGTDFELPRSLEVILRMGSVSRPEKSQNSQNLILEVSIPLLEHETYDLYRLHSVPILHNLTKKQRVSAHIVPRTPYAAFFGNDSIKYVLLSQQDLGNCHEGSNHFRNLTWICRHEQPVFGHRSCESAMFRGPMTRDDLFLCDIKITRVQQSYWHYLPRMGSWLYLLPREIELKIICPGVNRSQVVRMKDTGILKIRSDCYGKHKLTMLMGTQELGTTKILEKLQLYSSEEKVDLGEEIRQISDDALWMIFEGNALIEVDSELKKIWYCEIRDYNVIINIWWILMSLVTFLMGIKVIFFSNLCRLRSTRVDIRVGGELGQVINVNSIDGEL